MLFTFNQNKNSNKKFLLCCSIFLSIKKSKENSIRPFENEKVEGGECIKQTKKTYKFLDSDTIRANILVFSKENFLVDITYKEYQ